MGDLRAGHYQRFHHQILDKNKPFVCDESAGRGEHVSNATEAVFFCINAIGKQGTAAVSSTTQVKVLHLRFYVETKSLSEGSGNLKTTLSNLYGTRQAGEISYSLSALAADR